MMISAFIRTCTVLLFIALPQPLLAQSKESSKSYQLDTDVVYSKPNGKEMKLDIAYPKQGKGPFPAVVCVHGGAWRMGNKKDLRTWLELLADQGYVAVSVGYRLIPDHPWPTQIEDCKTAVRWLRTHAEKWNLNDKKIGAMGYSAGGHLVSLLGCTNKNQGFEGSEYPDANSDVQAVVSYFGPTDLTFYGNDESAENAVFKPMFGYRFKEKPEAYEKASPINYVTKKAPPFLFFHGTADRLVPIDQSRKMYQKLKENGVEATICEIKDADHGWGGEDNRKTTRQTLEFFAEHLKK